MAEQHIPVTIEEFNGFWSRGDIDTCPIDHFTESINIKYKESGFTTRDGINACTSQYPNKSNIVRQFSFESATVGQGCIALDNTGKFWHLFGVSAFNFLTVAAATDFCRVEYAGHVYICPTTYNSPTGVVNEFMYFYKGDGLTAGRKAGGAAPVNADGALAAANSATTGNVSAGYHVFAVAYVTNSGFITKLGPDTLPALLCTGGFKVDLTNIDISSNVAVTARWLLATKAIASSVWNGDTRGYEFFFVQEINDNTTASLTIDFFDTELVDSASYLLSLMSDIPACGGLGSYHGRLIGWNNNTSFNEVILSTVGEPESIDSASGLVTLPQSSYGITRCQEYRDILYVCRANQTYAFSDNGDNPSTWSGMAIDLGLGCGKNGAATSGDIGQALNLEFLIIMNNAGIFLFNGTFQFPELSYKIKDYWSGIGYTEITMHAQIVNDQQSKKIYISLPDTQIILVGDYTKGLDPKNIKWSKWTFGMEPTSILISNVQLTPTLCITNKTGVDTGIYQVVPGQTHDVLYSSGSVKIPDPTWTTALMGDDSGEDLLHFGGIRTRITGSGTLQLTLLGLDGITTYTVPSITMNSTPGKEPYQLSNFTSQRARLQGKTTAIDANFNINRIIAFVKKLWSNYPR